MNKIERMITQINRTLRNNKQNVWLVIHYVGAVSTARNNALYFNKEYRGASAHYFVDPTSIYQVVEDKDDAWHIGAKKYYNGARNSNSIGIEMCCIKKDCNWYIEPATIDNTIELAVQIMQKYNINLDHLVRHYDCTRKVCPEPFVRNPDEWIDFKNKVKQRLEEKEMTEPTESEKEEKIMDFYSLDANTIQFFRYYRYGQALIDKLYYKAKNSEK